MTAVVIKDVSSAVLIRAMAKYRRIEQGQSPQVAHVNARDTWTRRTTLNMANGDMLNASPELARIYHHFLERYRTG